MIVKKQKAHLLSSKTKTPQSPRDKGLDALKSRTRFIPGYAATGKVSPTLIVR